MADDTMKIAASNGDDRPLPNYEVMPDPTPEMLARPEFEAVWSVIKTWDVNVPEVYSGYCCANGSHVAMIVRALDRARQAGAGGGVVEALRAIAEGYAVSARDDRYIVVENPEYRPDDGSPPNLVIDTAALAPSPSAGEPYCWVREYPGHFDPQNGGEPPHTEFLPEPERGAFPLYRATPPATPVQPTASVEGVEAIISRTMKDVIGSEGGVPRVDYYALKKALVASLTPTQRAGAIAPMVEPFDDKWLGDGNSVHVPPTPSSPVSAPSNEETASGEGGGSPEIAAQRQQREQIPARVSQNSSSETAAQAALSNPAPAMGRGDYEWHPRVSPRAWQREADARAEAAACQH